MNDIEDKIVHIVSEQFGISKKGITDKSMIRELGADSLDFVEMVMDIEDEFEMAIPDEHVDGFRTIGDIVQYITEAKKKDDLFDVCGACTKCRKSFTVRVDRNLVRSVTNCPFCGRFFNEGGK